MNKAARITITGRVAALILFPTLLSLLLAIQTYIRYLGELDFGTIFYQELFGWYSWAALFPLIQFLCYRYPIDRQSAPSRWLLYAAFATAVAVLHQFVDYFFYWLLVSSVEIFKFDTGFVFHTVWRMFIFGAIAVVCHVYRAIQMNLDEEMRSAELKMALDRTRLQKLKVEVEPARIFSALEEIERLIDEKLLSAEIRIAELGDYLRERLQPLEVVSSEQNHRNGWQNAGSVREKTSYIQQWGFLAIVYSVVAGYFFSRQLLYHNLGPDPPTIVGWFLWIPLTPIVLHLSNRYPIGRASKRNLLIHFAANCFIVICIATVVLIPFLLLNGRSLDWSEFVTMRMKRASFAFDVITYWTIVAAGTVVQYERFAFNKKIQNTMRQSQLVQAQLYALKMQIHPHFLFNTLNSLSQLMYENTKAAKEMLRRLSFFFKLSLSELEKEEVTLAEELHFLEHYLHIQQTRFEGRLTVSMDLEEASVKCFVPNLILQPLVENAIRHGIESKSQHGCIRISSKKIGEKLILEIQDNGPGIRTNRMNGGLGLEITRSRLNQLYGAEQELAIRNASGGGCIATLTIPALYSRRELES